ncbi:MAG: hypothetical protein AAFV07_21455, partial [Bacteroidota bacterium]
SAYVQVARPNDPPGDFYLDLAVTQTPFGVEPLDSLQELFDAWTPPNCQAAIPATAISVDRDTSLTLDNGHIWVCTPDTLFLSGKGNTVYLENEAACVIESGEENKVYLRRESYLTAPGILRNEVYYQPGSKFVSAGFFPTYFSCDSVEYDYADAPFGACRLDTTTSLSGGVGSAFRVQFHPDSKQLTVTGNHIQRLILLDIHGRMVNGWTANPFLDHHAVSLSNIAPGIYFIRIQGGQVFYAQKIWIRS